MSFFRSVAVLVSGTAIGHGITAAALPVLSRIYTPADFSVLAVFAGLVSILSVAICLRFDVAVALPEDRNESFHILVLSVVFALTISSVVLIATLIFPTWLATQINQPQLNDYFWLIPFGAFFLGCYSALQMWFVREKAFRSIATSRIGQSIACATIQIVTGLAKFDAAGLLLGNIANSAIASLYLGAKLIKDAKADAGIKYPSKSTLKAVFSKYNRFPKYSTFEGLLNVASVQTPILLIAANTSSPEAGFLLFSLTVIQAPIALFGSSIGQVFLSHAPAELRANTLDIFTRNTLKKLAITGGPIIMLMGVLAPIVFPYIFGLQWERSGVLIAWMTPWIALQFLTSPLSMVLHITQNQHLALQLQLLGLILRGGCVWIAVEYFESFAGEIYAISGMVFYAIYLLTILHASKKSRQQDGTQ